MWRLVVVIVVPWLLPAAAAVLSAVRSPAALEAVQAYVAGRCTGVAKVADCGPDVGWGLVATKAVRAGNTVFEVPQSACVTGASVRDKSEQLEGFEGFCGDLALIALDILDRDVPEGYFPIDLEPFPTLLGDADPGCCSSRAFGALRENALDDYRLLRDLHVLDCDEIDFLRAVCLALSRSFPVGGELVYAPGIDFLNHDDLLDPETEALDWRRPPFGEPTLRLRASADVAANGEIRVSYGPLGVAEYLETYGFVPSRGPARRLAQVAELRFELTEESARFAEDKVDVLERAGYEEPALDVGVGGEVDPELVRFLRLRALEGPDAFLLEPVFEKQLWDDFLTLPISKANEHAALTAIQAEARAALDLLETPAPSPTAALDLVRNIESKALADTLAWIDTQLASLDTLEFYQERRLRDLGLDSEWSTDDAQWSAGRTPGSVDW